MRQTIDEPGALVGGRYRLLELAGEGGMAEVWKAELEGAMGFRRTLALKRILPHLADSETYRAMFVREASLSATLDHPNIVQVFDLGQDAAGLYMVMEWVEGLTLKELAGLCEAYGVRPSPALVAAIMIEVLRGLSAAHEQTTTRESGQREPAPIIHRDVSPSNVLLSVRGVIKLGDFGLARALDEAGLTPDGIVKGKLAYMAPEIVHGRPLTPQADLYGVGVVFWETLTGQRLFGGMNEGEIVMALVRGQRPPPVRSVSPAVPEAMATVVDRALEAAPERRFDSAVSFARALGDVLRTIPERTDTSRLAREFSSAMAAQRRLREAHRTSAPSPSPAAGSPPEAQGARGSHDTQAGLGTLEVTPREVSPQAPSPDDSAQRGSDPHGPPMAIPLVRKPPSSTRPGR